jgi:hypothetical protein
MLIAVVTATVMQMAVDHVVHVIAMGDRLVLASSMQAIAGNRSVLRGVRCTHGDLVLVVVALMLAVQVPVVQVIYMAVVLHARVPAILSVDMSMVVM